MYYYDGSVYLEDDDQCQNCAHFAKGVACPLLQALGMGLVTMQDSMVVTNCGFFKEFKRHLRVITENGPSNDTDETPPNNIRNMK